MANWPNELPKPALSGYSIEPQNAVIKTQMEAGPARYRKRYTAVPMDVRGSVFLSPAQMAIFKTFYQTTINFGADWFTFDGLNTGEGYTIGSEAHFTEPYKASIGDRGYWNVSFSLEVRNA
jgi:hypothetical protein